MTEADLGDTIGGDKDGQRYAIFEGQKADFVDLRELFGSPAEHKSIYSDVYASCGGTTGLCH